MADTGDRALTGAVRDAARPALLLAALVALGLAVRLVPGGASLHGMGANPIGLVAMGGLLCAVGVPRQIVCYAAGAACGIGAGIAVAMLAQVIGCVADLAASRLLARDWVARRTRGRLAAIDRLLRRRPFLATLTLRLLPVGNNLVTNLVAGLSGIAVAPFLAASALGYLPQTAVFVLAGAGVGTARWFPLVLAAALFAASAMLSLAVLRAERSGSREGRVPIAS